MGVTFHFVDVPASHHPETLCRVVAEGLAQPQKRLDCRFFYDTPGSELFERICELPEYYVTRTEHAILSRSAAEIAEAAGNDLMLIEFGSGNSCKTRLLIETLLQRQPELHYVPIDIAADFLRRCCLDLMADYPALSVTGIAAEYSDGIAALPSWCGPRLILFLGSNIGNFERDEAIAFLGRIRARMQPQDRVLIGVDLVKDRRVLEAAYNDAAGITARFNKNLLVRINRELGGRFELDEFVHEAPFREHESRIEMHLCSTRRQRVHIGYLEQDYLFEQGESIHTENSHKYTVDGFGRLCAAAGLSIQERWMDEREWFALMLLRPTDHDADGDEPGERR
jgi:dimethylhistidine N-methyltransferase